MSIDPVGTSFFIDGGWREPSNASTFPVISPLTEEEIGSVPAAGTADVDAAVDAARTAFRRSGWRDLEPSERAKHLRRFADELEARAEDLARTISRENGSPLSETRGAAAAVLGGWLFVRRQRRMEQPLLDFSIFRNPAFSAGVLAATFAMFAIGGIQLVTTQRFQQVAGFSPLEAGLLVAAIAVGSLPTALLGGAFLHRTGLLALITGGLAFATGGVVVTVIGFQSSFGVLILGLLWIVVYYVAGDEIGFMDSLGAWNFAIGFGGMVGGLIMSMNWR